MEQWDALGPAEKLVAKQIHETLSKSAGIARRLSDDLDELKELDIEQAMLDPKHKDTLIHIATSLAKMPDSLAGASLVMTIMKIIFLEKKTA